MTNPVKGQIYIDNGQPVALDENTITGRAFNQLAANVVEQTELRNANQAPTQIVEVSK